LWGGVRGAGKKQGAAFIRQHLAFIWPWDGEEGVVSGLVGEAQQTRLDVQAVPLTTSIQISPLIILVFRQRILHKKEEFFANKIVDILLINLYKFIK